MLMLLYILVYTHTAHYNKSGHGNTTSGALSFGEYDWKRTMPIPRAAYSPSLFVFCDIVIPHYNSPVPSDCASNTIHFPILISRSMLIKSKCGNGTVRTTMIVVNGENEILLLNTLYTYNCTVLMLMLLYWYINILSTTARVAMAMQQVVSYQLENMIGNEPCQYQGLPTCLPWLYSVIVWYHITFPPV